MVQSLERISSIESKEVSRGFAALYAGEYNKAQVSLVDVISFADRNTYKTLRHAF